jgi:hypothetical protein
LISTDTKICQEYIDLTDTQVVQDVIKLVEITPDQIDVRPARKKTRIPQPAFRPLEILLVNVEPDQSASLANGFGQQQAVPAMAEGRINDSLTRPRRQLVQDRPGQYRFVIDVLATHNEIRARSKRPWLKPVTRQTSFSFVQQRASCALLTLY